MIKFKDTLTPLFCNACGNRIGWCDDEEPATRSYCDDCADNEPDIDDEEEEKLEANS